MSSPQIQTILFDLDGTLLDTAPDLAQALNATLQANGRAALSFEQIRPAVSHGGSALIRLGFQLEPQHPQFEPLRAQLLDYYQAHIADETRLFPGMEKVLEYIEARGLSWGVVTNKPGWLTEPLLEALDLQRRKLRVLPLEPEAEPDQRAAAMRHHRPDLFERQGGTAVGLQRRVQGLGEIGRRVEQRSVQVEQYGLYLRG